MQICVPLNINLICGLVLIFLLGYYQSPPIPTIHTCFRQNSLHLRLPSFFTINTAVVMAIFASQNFSGPKFDYS